MKLENVGQITLSIDMYRL